MRSDRLETVLKEVYRKRGETEETTLDPKWRTHVLRQIRTLSAKTEPPLMWLFQEYVWRLAPVACVLILALGIWMSRGALTPELDLAAFALDNPVGVNLLASFGM